MTAADLLIEARDYFRAGTLYKAWAKANPGEDKKLRDYWAAGGTPPDLRTNTGRALERDAQAWWALQPATLDPRRQFGACASNTVCWLDDTNRHTWLDHAHMIGCSWVRFDVNDQNGKLATFSQEIRALGMKTLCSVYPPNRDWTNTAFAGTVAAWGIADAIEWGNEPNMPVSWGPVGTPRAPDPVGWRASVNAAHTAIAGRVPLVSGGLSPAGTYNEAGFLADGGNHSVNPLNFLEAALKAGPLSADFVGFHPYVGDGHPPASIAWSYMPTVAQETGLKVWATEYGFESANVGEDGQAVRFTEGIASWLSASYAGGPLFVYNLHDGQDGGGSTPFGSFGVFRADWTSKPAVAAIGQAMSA